jgi:peptide/nickel transport system substrate-binding protein
MTVSHARPLALALVLLSILTSGCTKIQTSTSLSSTSNPWTVHGILRVGSYEDLDSLNPIVSTQAFVTDVDQMVFSGLIDYDEHGNPVPDVALEVPTTANGGISRDGKTITYHLRRGVKFTDGVPLTSADVKYTWEQIVNPSNNVGYRYPYDQVVSVDTPDDYTVIVHLRAPLASFVAAFMRNGVIGSIVPRHVLSGYAGHAAHAARQPHLLARSAETQRGSVPNHHKPKHAHDGRDESQYRFVL